MWVQVNLALIVVVGKEHRSLRLCWSYGRDGRVLGALFGRVGGVVFLVGVVGCRSEVLVDLVVAAGSSSSDRRTWKVCVLIHRTFFHRLRFRLGSMICYSFECLASLLDHSSRYDLPRPHSVSLHIAQTTAEVDDFLISVDLGDGLLVVDPIRVAYRIRRQSMRVTCGLVLQVRVNTGR